MKAALLLLIGALALRAVDITTAQVDNTRASYNAAETTLTPASFPLFLTGTYVVDGAVYAQPLLAGGCLILATMGGSIYCDDPATPGVVKWRTHVSDPQTTFISGDGSQFYFKPVGCLSTPVIDATRGRIWAVCATPAQGWKLYTLDLASGAVVSSSLLSGTISGSGCGSNSGVLAFQPAQHLQRAPLTLTGTRLLVTFASRSDVTPWHGWAMTYDVSTDTPAPQHVWNSTPNGCGGGIWQASGGVASDGASYFLATGNGDFDGVNNFGESAVRLDAASLTVADWWAPTNSGALSSVDADLGSGRVTILPGSILAFGAKDWNVRLLSAAGMGHQGAALQQLPTNPSPPAPLDGNGGVWGGAFANGVAYFPNQPGPLYAFPFSGSTLGTPTSTAASYASVQGLTVTPGLLWIVTTAASPNSAEAGGTLRALSPGTLAELWSAPIGNVSKFQSPTVANGRVYVGNDTGVVRMFSTVAPTVPQGKVSVSLLSWEQH